MEYYNSTRDRTFIAELMPHHPLYVPLIHEEAQAAMGQVHPDAVLQCRLLTEQGFEPDNYAEIFDAGPILTAKRNTLAVWQHYQPCTVAVNDLLTEAQPYLLGFCGELGFYAVVVDAVQEESTLWISESTVVALKLDQPHQQVWCLPLENVSW
ncbi:arginine N-succinyltransferase [Vibrio sp. PP-XX7]